MLLLELNRSAAEPLYVQVVAQIQAMIAKGAISPGEALPSSRALATHLGVNRTTIYRAYEELWALGYIDNRPGARSVVRNRPSIADEGASEEQPKLDWKEKRNWHSVRAITRLKSQHNAKSDAARLNFSCLAPDPRLMPVQAFRKSIAAVLNREGPGLLSYNDAQGYSPLRDFISRQMRQHCMNVPADAVVLTAGSQNSLDMLLSLYTAQGDSVIVEEPTYSAAIPLFERHGLKIVPVPMTSEGMDLAALDQAISYHNPKLIYTMPNFHNPTGISSNQAHRERLLDLSTKYNVPLVEDGFEEEMKYFGKAILPIKSMDRRGMVFYLGTFSKVLFPGLRVGWIAASEAVAEDLTLLKEVSVLSDATLNQAALAHFCEKGHYEKHVKRLHRIYKNRMQAALEALRTHVIPVAAVRVIEPAGGYTIWIEVSGFGIEEDELVAALAKAEVSVMPGRNAFLKRPDVAYLRLSIAALEEEEITEGIKIIGHTLAQMTLSLPGGKRA